MRNLDKSPGTWSGQWTNHKTSQETTGDDYLVKDGGLKNHLQVIVGLQNHLQGTAGANLEARACPTQPIPTQGKQPW